VGCPLVPVVDCQSVRVVGYLLVPVVVDQSVRAVVDQSVRVVGCPLVPVVDCQSVRAVVDQLVPMNGDLCPAVAIGDPPNSNPLICTDLLSKATPQIHYAAIKPWGDWMKTVSGKYGWRA